MRFKKEYLLVAVVFTVIMNGCKKWDDHTAIINQDLTRDLSIAIKDEPTLSTFSQLVTQAGLDSLLQSSKTYTVWAPTDAALATLDPSIPADINKLRSFILNHISNQLYFTRDVQTSKRIGMLNGKYNNVVGNKFEDATISTADRYVKNGVLHIIDKSILVLPNLWEYITSNTATSLQNSFIAGLDYTTFDPSLAIVDSISSSTGQPVYRPGTGIVIKNVFNEKVSDTRKEDKQYTYFVIADAGFTLKVDSLKPYFATGITTATDSLARWNVVKNVLVDTLYPTIASLPAFLVSKSGVIIPVNSAAITDSKKVSNGMVYVLSESAVNTVSRFSPIVIQGETPNGFLADRPANTSYRIKLNPVTNQNFSDIYVSGHGLTGFYSFYRLNEMPTMKYEVYILGVNDFQTNNVFQSVGVGYFTTPPATYTAVTTTPVKLNHAVPKPAVAGAYSEKMLGTFTSTSYGTLEFRLTSGGSSLGSSGNAPIVMDYLRIVPVP